MAWCTINKWREAAKILDTNNSVKEKEQATFKGTIRQPKPNSQKSKKPCGDPETFGVVGFPVFLLRKRTHGTLFSVENKNPRNFWIFCKKHESFGHVLIADKRIYGNFWVS